MLYGIGYTTVPVEKGPLFHARNTMVEAPSNYKDPMKIKEYIDKIKEKRKEEAYYSHMMCRLGRVFIQDRKGPVPFDNYLSPLAAISGFGWSRADETTGEGPAEYAVMDVPLFKNLLLLDHLERGLKLDKTDFWLFGNRFGQEIFPSDDHPDFVLFDPVQALTGTSIFDTYPAKVAAEFGFKENVEGLPVEEQMAKMAYYLGSVMGRDAN